MRTAGKTALLTGAAGGLGRAIATALAERETKLILSGRNREALEELASSLPGSGHRILLADLGEPGVGERLADMAGEFEIFVANAGLPGSGTPTDYSPEELQRVLRVNLEAPMLTAQALAPKLVERGEGHMVFVSSLSGKAAAPESSLYNATKFGIRGFALGLCADLRPQGVGVSVVSPGYVRESGMFARAGIDPPPGRGTVSPEQVGAATVRAIERNKVEVVVGGTPHRAIAHLSLVSPGLAARVQGAPSGH
jgi:short-subunit dehydrogenase